MLLNAAQQAGSHSVLDNKHTTEESEITFGSGSWIRIPAYLSIGWVLGALSFIYLAEPYGRYMNAAEKTYAILWIVVPAVAIFSILATLNIVSGKSISQSAAQSFDSWATDKQTKEFEEFIGALKSMDAEEIGLPVAMATDFRNRLLKAGMNLGEPAIVCALYPEFTYKLSREAIQLQQQGRPIDAVPLMIWVHSLRAVSKPQLRGYGRKMWSELERGFKYVDQASLDFKALYGKSLNTNFSSEFPNGLTPKPLD